MSVPLTIVAFCIGAMACGLVLFLASRRTTKEPDCPAFEQGPGQEDADPAREISEFWEPPSLSNGDKRIRQRRSGNTTPVHVIMAEGGKPQRAYVVDRSSSGLRLTVQGAAAVGDTVRLLACDAPAKTRWAEATVCWCKTEDGRTELGCRFNDVLPWSVLLLFG